MATPYADPNSPHSPYDAHNGAEINRNVEFIRGRGFWWSYIITLFVANIIVYTALSMAHTQLQSMSWTFINVVHSLATFYIMHWLKGVPFPLSADQGRYDEDTFWEQINNGRQNTQTRTMFSLVPLGIFAAAVYSAKVFESMWIDNAVWAVNFGFTLLAFIPKMDAFHHVRLGGINRD